MDLYAVRQSGFRRPAGDHALQLEQAKMSNKDEYVATMKAQLDEWSAQISALEARAQEVRDDARAAFDEQLSALRVKRQEGETKLAEIQAAGETTWEQVKAEAENVRLAFMDAAHAFQSHFK